MRQLVMPNSNRGFASMDKQRRIEIASLGGKSQNRFVNSGNFANRSEDEVREAGRKGGQNRAKNMQREREPSLVGEQGR